MEKTVDELNLQLDDYKQYSRRNTLRITGVPDEEGEQLVDKMVYLFNTTMNVSPPITPEHIDRTNRIGRFDGTNPRTILVKFAIYQARDRVFRARRKLKKKINNRGVGGAETLPEEDDDNKVDDSDHESENFELQESDPCPPGLHLKQPPLKMPLFMSMRIWQSCEPRFSGRQEN